MRKRGAAPCHLLSYFGIREDLFSCVGALRGYGPSWWGSHGGRNVRQRRLRSKENVATQFIVCSLFSVEPMGWRQPQARWGSPYQLSLSGNALIAHT